MKEDINEKNDRQGKSITPFRKKVNFLATDVKVG
jgi:hypothetical protein